MLWHCPSCGREWTTGATVAVLFHECRARRLRRTVAIPEYELSREDMKQRIWEGFGSA